MSERMVSIVVPMHNEASVIGRSLDEIAAHPTLAGAQVVLVDDGSTDGTGEIVQRWLDAHDEFDGELVSLAHNQGKGSALRAGVAVTSCPVVMFTDADLSASLDDVEDLLTSLQHFDVAIASRGVEGATEIGSRRSRMAMGRAFNVLVRTVGGVDVKDSQCGLKVFRGDVARELFALSECDGYGFDPEVLRLAGVLGYSVTERPVRWKAGAHSSVRPVRDSLRTGVDLVRIRWRTRPSRVLRRAEALSRAG